MFNIFVILYFFKIKDCIIVDCDLSNPRPLRAIKMEQKPFPVFHNNTQESNVPSKNLSHISLLILNKFLNSFFFFLVDDYQYGSTSTDFNNWLHPYFETQPQSVLNEVSSSHRQGFRVDLVNSDHIIKSPYQQSLNANVTDRTLLRINNNNSHTIRQLSYEQQLDEQHRRQFNDSSNVMHQVRDDQQQNRIWNSCDANYVDYPAAHDNFHQFRESMPRLVEIIIKNVPSRSRINCCH